MMPILWSKNKKNNHTHTAGVFCGNFIDIDWDFVMLFFSFLSPLWETIFHKLMIRFFSLNYMLRVDCVTAFLFVLFITQEVGSLNCNRLIAFPLLTCSKELHTIHMYVWKKW